MQFRSPLLSALKEFYFCIDYRSLGLFRILLGLLLIHSWIDRFADREIFYSSAGVLPPDVVASFDPTFKLCFTDYLSSTAQIELFFGLGLFFYVLFTLGYKSKLFHSLSFLFYASQTCKCSILKSGGQRALAVFLLWSLFLPMAKRFALDARKRKSGAEPGDQSVETRSAPSLAAFVIVFQIALIYALSAFSKFGPTWLDGSAIYYTLERDAIVRPLGIFMRDHLTFLYQPLNYGTLIVEWLAAPFILSPLWQPRLRHLIIAALIALHMGIWLTINVCDFSLVMMASYVLLLSSQDWQAIQRFCSRLGGRSLLPELGTASFAASITKSLPLALVNAVVAALFAVVLIDAAYFAVGSATKISDFKRPPFVARLCYALSIGQDWRLFAPDPSMDDGWYVVVGFTESGAFIDPLTGKAPTATKPGPGEMYPTCNWRKYAHYLHRSKLEGVARAFCQYYLHKSQNAAPGQRLVGIKLYYINESTPPIGTPRPFPTEVELVYCLPESMVERSYPPLDDSLDIR